MIRETEAELVRADQLTQQYGDSVSTRLMTASLRHRLTELQERFAVATDRQEIDVCTYRLISDRNGRYPISALASALSEFQRFLTVTFEAVSNESPRRTTKSSAKSRKRTELDVAYSFAGSLGFALTMQRESGDAADSALENSIAAMFALAKAKDTDAVAEFAKKYGAGPVQVAHKWAKAHADAGISADIQWKRGGRLAHAALAQVSEFHHLARIIEDAGETTVSKIELYGSLIAGNLETKSFIFQAGEERVSGKLDEAFSMPPGADMSLGHQYRALIKRETKRLLVTDRDIVSNRLLELSPISSSRS